MAESTIAHYELSAHSVGLAREQIDGLDGVPSPTLEDARLLLGELVTNSLRHASLRPGQLIEVRASVIDRVLRVEVGDQGDGFVHRPRSDDEPAGTGWGLLLVEELADRWGVSSGELSQVWFELDFENPPRR